MASEVLKTPPPKLAQKTDPKPLPTAVPPPNIEKKPFSPPAPVPPADIEVKTIVSRGVNTDESGNTCVRVLEEIKPILETASSKIGTNSLLVSVIENIQNKSGESSKDAKQVGKTKANFTTEQTDPFINLSGLLQFYLIWKFGKFYCVFLMSFVNLPNRLVPHKQILPQSSSDLLQFYLISKFGKLYCVLLLSFELTISDFRFELSSEIFPDDNLWLKSHDSNLVENYHNVFHLHENLSPKH